MYALGSLMMLYYLNAHVLHPRSLYNLWQFSGVVTFVTSLRSIAWGQLHCFTASRQFWFARTLLVFYPINTSHIVCLGNLPKEEDGHRTQMQPTNMSTVTRRQGCRCMFFLIVAQFTSIIRSLRRFWTRRLVRRLVWLCMRIADAISYSIGSHIFCGIYLAEQTFYLYFQPDCTD